MALPSNISYFKRTHVYWNDHKFNLMFAMNERCKINYKYLIIMSTNYIISSWIKVFPSFAYNKTALCITETL